tara:strand:- start:176 stop:946 length:771 start_codon:yes stop_codon:yes gene_type:complete
MPLPSDNPDLFPVFLGSGHISESGLKREAVLLSGKSQTVPMHLGVAYVNDTTDFLELVTPGTTLIGRNSSIIINTLVVAAPEITLRNLIIGNLTFKKGNDFTKLKLINIVLGATSRIVPTAAQHTVDLNGAVIQNITGGAVALFRTTGSVTCAGEFTRCFVLEKNEPGREQVDITSEDGATVVDVSAITKTFGPQYMIDYFAFDKVEETLQASDLANALVWPTLATILSVILAHGSPKKVGEPPQKVNTPAGPNDH